MKKDKWGANQASVPVPSWRQRRDKQPNKPETYAKQDLSLMANTLQSLVVEQRRARRWRIFFFLIVLAIVGLSVSPVFFINQVADEADMQSWLQTPYTQTQDITQPHVALVRLEGLIAADAVSASWVNRQLRDAMQNDQAQALVLQINSPGGSPVQAERIYAELLRLRQEHDKPVYAVIDDLGASAAYYIAVGSDEIYANINSLVGSIGVISPGFGLVDLIDKLGIERRVQTAGANKAFLDPFQDLDPEIEAFWQDALERIHQNFIAAVEQARSAKIQNKNDVYSGLLYTGDLALQLGLIDGFADTDNLARNTIGVENIVDYSARAQSWLDLVREFAVSTIWELGAKVDTLQLR